MSETTYKIIKFVKDSSGFPTRSQRAIKRGLTLEEALKNIANAKTLLTAVKIGFTDIRRSRPMNETKNAIYEMLTESTGEHFLDSGGDDGRHSATKPKEDSF